MKNILFFIALPLVFAACATKGKTVEPQAVPPAPSMVFASEEANKIFPLDVNDALRIERMDALSGNVFRYVLVLKKVTKDDVDMAKLKLTLEPVMLENLKNDKDSIEMFRNQNINLEILFLDANGDEAFTIIYPHGIY